MYLSRLDVPPALLCHLRPCRASALQVFAGTGTQIMSQCFEFGIGEFTKLRHAARYEPTVFDDRSKRIRGERNRSGRRLC